MMKYKTPSLLLRHACRQLLGLGCLAAVLNAPAMAKAPAQQGLQMVTEYNPPAEYLDAKGKVSGVTVDLLRIIMQRLGEQGQFTIMPWSRALLYAQTQSEVILFETVRTTEREPLFNWVGPLKHYQIWLYARSDRADNLLTDEQLSASNIACSYRNSAIVDDVRRLGFSEKNNLVLTTKVGDCVGMLNRGRVDLITVSEIMLHATHQQLAAENITLKAVKYLTERQLYLAFSADIDAPRVARWQHALEQSYQDGTMRKLYQGVYAESIIQRLEDFARAK